MRFSALCITVFIAILALSGTLDALTEDEKKRLFLKAREEMFTIPVERPKPPQPRPRPTPSPRRAEPRTPEPAEKPLPSATPTVTPVPTPVPSPKLETPSPVPSPAATPAPQDVTPPPAPVVIRKSGLEEEAGEEPPPPREGRRFWIFGRGPSYKYLTRSVRDEIDRARVKKRRWRYIVVHNSGSRQGNAKIFDYYHRHVRRMPNGLAYHFVIGNGHGSGEGQIEVGDRWRRQINGGHVHSDYLNNIAIGICLVGDFNRTTPSKVQLEALEELIRYLRLRVGKTDGKPAGVKPHKAINPPRWPTDCPGDRFPYNWFHKFRT